ncbi:hypothetical protein PENARI_c030G09180 [Penicillium arizonense]|uniref:Uncharacterized protein n=1 Tax=Penicillium arizonense TaxID=1835702 RepID=A0A1F5L4Y8_PENAI|nr:hypothetical protein PENARI_c030G09180 [Penicillium arizonense]OGE48283.1 hypothetical protein PENARI_c030G09180 [Penicillium arizonense]
MVGQLSKKEARSRVPILNRGTVKDSSGFPWPIRRPHVNRILLLTPPEWYCRKTASRGPYLAYAGGDQATKSALKGSIDVSLQAAWSFPLADRMACVFTAAQASQKPGSVPGDRCLMGALLSRLFKHCGDVWEATDRHLD